MAQLGVGQPGAQSLIQLFKGNADGEHRGQFSIEAVVSATPSITPSKIAPEPRAATYTGMRGYIISEAASVKRLTIPSIITACGIRFMVLSITFAFNYDGINS